MLNRCMIYSHCENILTHISILRGLLKKDDTEATVLELKEYYWLLQYFNNYINRCAAVDGSSFLPIKNEIDTFLLKIFAEHRIDIDEKTAKCDVCKILPCAIFPLLDLACELKKQDEIENMCKELEYHLFLAFLLEDNVGRCRDCNSFVDLECSLKLAGNFLKNRDVNALQQNIFFWKKAENTDALMNQAAKIKRKKYKYEMIPDKDINTKTAYLDFNVFGKIETDIDLKCMFIENVFQEHIEFFYGATHMEEILRMGDLEYQKKRIETIKIITKENMILPIDKTLKYCTGNIDENLEYIKDYEKINQLGEERSCIQVEVRGQLFNKYQDENSLKHIGMSSLSEMINNVNELGGKKNMYIPNEEEINIILRYIDCGTEITAYKDIFKNSDISFEEIRLAIVSLSTLCNILGLHADKVSHKNNNNTNYPVYDKSSYRTVRSGFYDNDHLAFATKCDYFVTTDKTLCRKAKDIYSFVGCKTEPILLNEFEKLLT